MDYETLLSEYRESIRIYRQRISQLQHRRCPEDARRILELGCMVWDMEHQVALIRESQRRDIRKSTY